MILLANENRKPHFYPGDVGLFLRDAWISLL
jgi:hypothetical protein